MDCVFCKIARKELPSEIVYEDEKFVAFLDIHPRSKGMTIIAPKEHLTKIDEIPKEIFEVAIKISVAIQKALSPKAISIALMPSQIDHIHLRIYPYFENEIPLIENKPIEVTNEELKDICEKIRENLQIKKEEITEIKKEEIKEDKKRERSEEETFWIKRDWMIA